MTVATSMGGVSAFGDQPAHRHLLSDHLRRGQLLWARRCRHSCAHAQQVAWSIAGSLLRNTGSTPRRLIHLPAVPEWSDFDDRHVKAVCILLLASLPVRLNMIEPKNGHAPTTSADKYTGAIILRTRPHTYKRVVRLLSEGVPAIRIARDCKVTERSVAAIAKREREAITERKKSLAGLMSNIAEIGGANVGVRSAKLRCVTPSSEPVLPLTRCLR